jgi:5-methylcytosine-specific restriction endonuclease McrA
MLNQSRVTVLRSSLREIPVNDPDNPSWRTGLTSAQRGYDARWSQARIRYLSDHPLCAYCARDGALVPASVVDHIIPHRGDKVLFWDESNWQSLCKPCHDSAKAMEERAMLRGCNKGSVKKTDGCCKDATL